MKILFDLKMLKNVDGNVFAFYIKLAATLKIRKKKKTMNLSNGHQKKKYV